MREKSTSVRKNSKTRYPASFSSQTPMSLVPAAPTPAFVFSSALVIGCGYAFASVSCYARGEVGKDTFFACSKYPSVKSYHFY